jgi:hypothetical protein
MYLFHPGALAFLCEPSSPRHGLTLSDYPDQVSLPIDNEYRVIIRISDLRTVLDQPGGYGVAGLELRWPLNPEEHQAVPLALPRLRPV